MAMSLFATSALAQEVRGVETRRAVYEGDSYVLYYFTVRGDHERILGTKNEYLGFEFTNKNSISVSVTIEVYEKRSSGDILIDTKDIVLKRGESYIHKKPVLKRYETYSISGIPHYDDETNSEIWKGVAEYGEERANKYYVKYKAYKLQ